MRKCIIMMSLNIGMEKIIIKKCYTYLKTLKYNYSNDYPVEKKLCITLHHK